MKGASARAEGLEEARSDAGGVGAAQAQEGIADEGPEGVRHVACAATNHSMLAGSAKVDAGVGEPSM
jgi:hypothetical protein